MTRMHKTGTGKPLWRFMGVWVMAAVLLLFAPRTALSRTGCGPAQEEALAVWIALNDTEEYLEKYQNLSPDEKARLRKKLREWESLPPEKQKALRRKMEQLKKMPPEARRIYRQRFEQWQKLPPSEQNALRKKLENWDRLSPKEKKAVRHRFK
ncbi:hypothetical protein DENIS_3849 [Desulfonema ishimotonii]|uniref:DUF3106 domain-containing protein n=1 Tax=Desulfonema ishimotonii TaxID=45657 RepID=A0A401G0W6_9BACT|nr:DUF3106 domain-containing protein [Desulfonema ishimotonii]GBC62865.1 hypothetical protein DENIS_3849 [Desulfonema ishimotonii]